MRNTLYTVILSILLAVPATAGDWMIEGGIGGGQYDCGYPLAKQVGTSMVLIKIPFGNQ